ncbi:hypothetical protein B6U66_02015 [Candidatus Bathyarchaeota archaeon ex4484_135]|nr:MAG: hypothetical protein B6U66_02015 [Candidatus Bathyarchaeota archaeon ex4484_135]
MKAYEIEPRGPYSLHLTFTGTEPAFPTVYDGRYLWRVVETGEGLVPVRVEQIGPREEPLLRVEVFSSRGSGEALEALCQFLCAHDDLRSAYDRMRTDRALREMLPYVKGMMPWTAFGPLEGLVDAILFQQISLRAAFSIIRRFVEGLGRPVKIGQQVLYAFPSPEDIMRAGPEVLRSLGLSKNKASYVFNLAKAVLEGFDPGGLGDKPTEEAMEILMSLKGVGRWTAEIFMATGLKRWEVVPADDLGIKRAFRQLYGVEDVNVIRSITSGWERDAWPIAYYMLVWCERKERVMGTPQEAR